MFGGIQSTLIPRNSFLFVTSPVTCNRIRYSHIDFSPSLSIFSSVALTSISQKSIRTQKCLTPPLPTMTTKQPTTSTIVYKVECKLNTNKCAICQTQFLHLQKTMHSIWQELDGIVLHSNEFQTIKDATCIYMSVT